MALCPRCGKQEVQCEDHPTNCIWEGKRDPRYVVHKKTGINKSRDRRSYYYDVYTACDKIVLIIENRYSDRWRSVTCKKCIKRKGK